MHCSKHDPTRRNTHPARHLRAVLAAWLDLDGGAPPRGRASRLRGRHFYRAERRREHVLCRWLVRGAC